MFDAPAITPAAAHVTAASATRTSPHKVIYVAIASNAAIAASKVAAAVMTGSSAMMDPA